MVSLFAKSKIVKSQPLCAERVDLLAISIRGAKREDRKLISSEKRALALSLSLFLVSTSDVRFLLDTFAQSKRWKYLFRMLILGSKKCDFETSQLFSLVA